MLDRVRQDGVVRCGGTIRPGLAFPAPDGSWHGLEVDLCRAAALAVLGAPGRIEFHADAAGSQRGGDDIAFVTASEMLADGLLPALLPGPPVVFLTAGVLVPDGAPARHLADLAGTSVCAEPGTGPERSLLAWQAAHGMAMHFFMFQEADEMLDALYAGRCGAVAHEMPSLAALRLQAAQDGHPARLLPEPLAAAPVLAATPRADADWAADVTWTLATLQQPDPAALPLAGAALGLPAGWQAAVLAAGSYAVLYDRNLGAGSPLGLPPGLNAPWTQGGLLCPPVSQ